MFTNTDIPQDIKADFLLISNFSIILISLNLIKNTYIVVVNHFSRCIKASFI